MGRGRDGHHIFRTVEVHHSAPNLIRASHRKLSSIFSCCSGHTGLAGCPLHAGAGKSSCGVTSPFFDGARCHPARRFPWAILRQRSASQLRRDHRTRHSAGPAHQTDRRGRFSPIVFAVRPYVTFFSAMIPVSHRARSAPVAPAWACGTVGDQPGSWAMNTRQRAAAARRNAGKFRHLQAA